MLHLLIVILFSAICRITTATTGEGFTQNEEMNVAMVFAQEVDAPGNVCQEFLRGFVVAQDQLIAKGLTKVAVLEDRGDKVQLLVPFEKNDKISDGNLEEVSSTVQFKPVIWEKRRNRAATVRQIEQVFSSKHARRNAPEIIMQIICRKFDNFSATNTSEMLSSMIQEGYTWATVITKQPSGQFDLVTQSPFHLEHNKPAENATQAGAQTAQHLRDEMRKCVSKKVVSKCFYDELNRCVATIQYIPFNTVPRIYYVYCMRQTTVLCDESHCEQECEKARGWSSCQEELVQMPERLQAEQVHYENCIRANSKGLGIKICHLKPFSADWWHSPTCLPRWLAAIALCIAIMPVILLTVSTVALLCKTRSRAGLSTSTNTTSSDGPTDRRRLRQTGQQPLLKPDQLPNINRRKIDQTRGDDVLRAGSKSTDQFDRDDRNRGFNQKKPIDPIEQQNFKRLPNVRPPGNRPFDPNGVPKRNNYR